MPNTKTTLVLGRGDLFFDRFDADTTLHRGEFYLGNTTNFTIQNDVVTEDRYGSYAGQKIQREGAIIQERHTASFTTDDVNIENVALWFGSPKQGTTFNPLGFVTESFVAWKNRFFQLGMSRIPNGARFVEHVTIEVGGDDVNVFDNFEVDKINGRIQVKADAPDVEEGQTFDVTFEWREQSSYLVSPAKREQFGSLRFVAANPKGPNRNYFYPMVRLKPKDNLDLLTESDWQKLSFDVEARRLNALTDYVYVDEFLSSALTRDEEAIIADSGIDLDGFPYWEDQLDTFTNTTLPSHGY